MLHAVILYSVGSPEALTVPQLRRFLQRFLSDKRVVQLPSFLWQPILQSFILRTRPHRLIKRYEQIFVDGHNPYLVTMERLCVDLENYLNECQDLQNTTTLAAQDDLALSQSFTNQLFTAEVSDSSCSHTAPNAQDQNKDQAAQQQFMVCPSYAFAGITIEEAINNCLHRGADKITVVPLFPQYSLCTNKTLELKLHALQRKGLTTPINCVYSYTAEPLYISALSSLLAQALSPLIPELNLSATKHDQQQGIEDIDSINSTANTTALSTLKAKLGPWLTQKRAHILLAYHGLPRSYLRTGEPYANECRLTTDHLGQALGLKTNEHYSVAFLGHMGPVKWMQPSLEQEVERLLQQHVQHLIVLAPSFAIDCLETLYDINIKLREFFLSKGGEQFTFVPALNDSTAHIALLRQLLTTAQPLKPQ